MKGDLMEQIMAASMMSALQLVVDAIDRDGMERTVEELRAHVVKSTPEEVKANASAYRGMLEVVRKYLPALQKTADKNKKPEKEPEKKIGFEGVINPFDE